jgi:hypothetical protein
MTTIVVRVPARQAAWQLRALVAMGHSVERIAFALGEDLTNTEVLVSGATRQIRVARLANITALYEAWWCLRPPEVTPAEQMAAVLAEQRARDSRWPCPAGHDEDRWHEPGYRPPSGWRHARGLGVATDNPLGLAKAA